jgi:thioredoxin 1
MIKGGFKMSINQLNMDKFEEEVLQSKQPVFVDFYADWCGPCKMMLPTVEEVAGEKSGAKFFKVNIDDNRDLAKKYKVMSIPTFIVFRDGEVHSRLMGAVDKDKILSMFE